ncbi:acyltransferase [Bryobacterales bacterium F-183]|nr:acyltransferase [Bryobacterales bacterium F-183]
MDSRDMQAVQEPPSISVSAPVAPTRLFSIDVLRGMAILLVMGVHIPAYPIWSTAGWIGVDLFFVLSGFLISNLLFAEYLRSQDIRLSRFFIRRALKLYPSFYLMLAVTFAYCWWVQRPLTANQILGELTLTQNYVGEIWGHTWSLAVEEHFYLFLPLLLTVLIRFRAFHAIPWIFAAIAITCLGLRIYAAQAHAFDHHLHFQPSHLRFDALFTGVFLSYLHNFRSDTLQRLMQSHWRMPLSMLGVGAWTVPALFLEYSDPRVYTIGFSAVSLGCAMLLLCSVYPEKGRKAQAPGTIAKAVARMGKYSYTIYLWHVPLAMLFIWLASVFPGVNPFLLHAIYFVLCILTGVLTARIVELPVLRLRDRYYP